MSLLGSSVNVVPSREDGAPLMRVESAESREDDNTAMVTASYENDDDDAHPPPTPPGAAEALFLSGLPTHNISATALAQQIHIRHRSSLAGTSIATDDFHSTTDQEDVASPTANDVSLLCMVEQGEADDEHPFGNDALIHSREALIIEQAATPDRNIKMAKTAPTGTTEPKPLEHLDPAEKIYDTAKGVWGWGKGIIIFSPFMGIAEGIAGKIIETAGSNMDDLDSAVLDRLHGLDDSVLNPAIASIVNTMLGAKDKTQGFFGPILAKVLSPFGLLKDKSEEESTMKPDGTTKVEASTMPTVKPSPAKK